MKYKITRRDFMNGVAVGTGATFLAPYELFAQLNQLNHNLKPATLCKLEGQPRLNLRAVIG